MLERIFLEPFDLDKHKAKFRDTYLEVLISPQGIIEYAVPSHQERLIKIACNKYNITRDELNDMTPPEYYTDFMVYLCRLTGYIAVWNNGTQGDINKKQHHVLQHLHREGLYNGYTAITVHLEVHEVKLESTLNSKEQLVVYALKKYPKTIKEWNSVLTLTIQESSILDETNTHYRINTRITSVNGIYKSSIDIKTNKGRTV